MVQRTVLKVQLSCEKCKKKLLKSISSIEGIDKIEIDGGNGTLAVTGDADPYKIITRATKAIKCVELMTVETLPASPVPAPAPEKEPPPAPAPPAPTTEKEAPPADQKVHDIYSCNMSLPNNCVCQPIAVVHMPPEPCTPCTIL